MEVGIAPGVVGIRDTTGWTYRTLVVTPTHFASFLSAVKAGEFDGGRG